MGKNVTVETIDAHHLRVTAGRAETMVDRSGATETSGFRSVDLLLGGLGSCMVGTMLGVAEERSIDVVWARVELRPIVAFGPERVSRVRMTMSLKGDISPAELDILKVAAESCKVHNSLHHGVQTELELELDPSSLSTTGAG